MECRWIYLVMGSVLNVTLGGLYVFSLYYKVLQTTFNLQFITPIALAYSITTLFDVAGVLTGGIIYDKRGPKFNVFLGACLLATGYTIGWSLQFFPNWDVARWLFYVGLGVLHGSGIGLVYSVTTLTVLKWFPDKPGLASGLVVFGFGIGAIFWTPLIQFFLNTVGVFQTFLYVGLTYGLVLILTGIFFKNPPPNYRVETHASNAFSPADGSTLMEAIKTSRFYALWLTHAFSVFAGLMIIGNIAPILSESGILSNFDLSYMTNTVIPAFMMIASIFNACGRPFWGLISDMVGPWRAMQLNFLSTAVLLIALSFGFVNVWYSLIFVGFIYLCYGGAQALFPPAVTLCFGRSHLGRIYGFICTGWGIAGLTGGVTGALIKDLTGSYLHSFYLAAVLSLIAAAVATYERIS